MTWPWIVVIVGVAVGASLTMIAVAGFLRHAIGALEVFESRLRSGASAGLNLGLSPGSIAEPFELQTAWGERVMFPDFIDRPTLLLLMSDGCSACKTLARRLPTSGIQGVALYVVLPLGTDAAWVRDGVDVLYQDRDSASRALHTTFTPHAFVVGVGGFVLDRFIPASLEDLERLALRQKGGEPAIA